MSKIIRKVKLQIRKGCFALYYDMCDKELTNVPDHDTYFRTLIAARDYGGRTRRCECYSSRTLKVDDKEYCIYLMGLGSMDRKKFIYGVNSMARAFGKCMFDQVFLMAEEKQFAREKILFRIKESLESNTKASLWNAKLMVKSYYDLFGQNRDVKALERRVNENYEAIEQQNATSQ